MAKAAPTMLNRILNIVLPSSEANEDVVDAFFSPKQPMYVAKLRPEQVDFFICQRDSIDHDGFLYETPRNGGSQTPDLRPSAQSVAGRVVPINLRTSASSFSSRSAASAFVPSARRNPSLSRSSLSRSSSTSSSIRPTRQDLLRKILGSGLLGIEEETSSKIHFQDVPKRHMIYTKLFCILPGHVHQLDDVKEIAAAMESGQPSRKSTLSSETRPELIPSKQQSRTSLNETKPIYYAIAVAIETVDMPYLEEMLTTHSRLVDMHLEVLKDAVRAEIISELRKHQSSSNPGILLPLHESQLRPNETIARVFGAFQSYICALYNTPRFEHPVWLTLQDEEMINKHDQVGTTFFNELSDLLQGRTRHFVFTMATSALSYHLGWVSEDLYENHDEIIPDIAEKQFEKTFGKVGRSPILCRFLVTGLQPQLVKRLLFILSYFIRPPTIPPVAMLERKQSMSDTTFDSPKSSDSQFAPFPLNSFTSTRVPNPSPYVSPPPVDTAMALGTTFNTAMTTVSSFASALSAGLQRSIDDSTRDQRTSALSNGLAAMDSPIASRESRHQLCRRTSNMSFSASDTPAIASFSRSMVVGMAESYLSDFMLMGAPPLDGQAQKLLEFELIRASKFFARTKPTQIASVIVDADAQQCILLHSDVDHPNHDLITRTELSFSDFVAGSLSRACELYRSGFATTHCFALLENDLLDFSEKALLLRHLVRSDSRNCDLTMPYLASTLGVHASDVPVIVRVGTALDDHITRLAASLQRRDIAV